ncbi:hypothetical protein [Pirellula sp. SH-Sr6A]|uniref:hypothetical protein n=1 Tax=Pirellula sp. SH-Sr6A TaxID=1632865 RepID=UPI0011BA4D03|nr:hypothetical protein [Pirellula sp. SH-Sr6A]
MNNANNAMRSLRKRSGNPLHSSSADGQSRQFSIEKQKAISSTPLRLFLSIGTDGIDSSAWPGIRPGILKFFVKEVTAKGR